MHKADMLYINNDKDKEMFAKITGISFDDCKDDPEHYDQQAKLEELLSLYYLDADHQRIRQIQGVSQTTPIDVQNIGPRLIEELHKHMIELLISLGSTPMAASKPTFMKFIEVCYPYSFMVFFL